jgi:hypothetical protein
MNPGTPEATVAEPDAAPVGQAAPASPVEQEPAAWLRADGMKAMPADEKAAWIEADERMRHDYPILQQLHSKHAMGALSAPSCLCCGESTQGREVAIQHLELPAIVICKRCRDAATGAAPSAESEQPKQPEHVCGLQGFGRGAGSENDECPACRQPRPEQPQQPEKDHLATPCGQAAPEIKLEGSQFESRGAQMLQAAWIDGWASCRDAEFIGDEAMNDAFNGSVTLSLCLATDQRTDAAPSPDAAPVGQEPAGYADATALRDIKAGIGPGVATIVSEENKGEGDIPLYTRPTDVLTKDEIADVLACLAPYHDGSDFEPECPGCTAYRKLSALTRAKEVQHG